MQKPQVTKITIKLFVFLFNGESTEANASYSGILPTPAEHEACLEQAIKKDVLSFLGVPILGIIAVDHWGNSGPILRVYNSEGNQIEPRGAE